MTDTIGILGGTGWLGGALGRNLLAQGHPAVSLIVLNRRGPTADYDAWPGVAWARDLADLAARADIVVLSVRPEDYAVPAPMGFAGLVVSFMAGVPLDDLARNWPAARIGRAMPGGGATEGTAHVPWCAPGLPGADVARVERLLSALGTVDRVVDEAALAYLTALSGSGVAYPALMAQAMLEDAAARGLDPEVAWRAVQSVICDAPQMLRGPREGVDRMIAAYRDYRGITAAGLDAAEAAGFKTAVGRALAAGTDRALTMRPGDRAGG